MTRSCHGLLTYFSPRGQESRASAKRASTPCMSGIGSRCPGGGSAGRGPVGPLGPGSVTPPPAPAVLNAIMFDHGPKASANSARNRQTYRLLAVSAGSTVNRTTPDASTAPVPDETMFEKSSESATWKRYENVAFATFRPKLMRPERVGVRGVLVCSNSGKRPMGVDTFRFEPSAFRALADSRTAVGDAGEFMARWQPAAATAAQSASPAAFICNRYILAPSKFS